MTMKGNPNLRREMAMAENRELVARQAGALLQQGYH